MTLTVDLLTLKVVSESRVTWATSVPILVFLGLSVLDLGPMYATDRRQADRQTHHRLIASHTLNSVSYYSPPLIGVGPLGAGHNNLGYANILPCKRQNSKFSPPPQMQSAFEGAPCKVPAGSAALPRPFPPPLAEIPTSLRPYVTRSDIIWLLRHCQPGGDTWR